MMVQRKDAEHRRPTAFTPSMERLLDDVLFEAPEDRNQDDSLHWGTVIQPKAGQGC